MTRTYESEHCLLVEGAEDRRVIPELLEHALKRPWQEEGPNGAVHVLATLEVVKGDDSEVGGGLEHLSPQTISTALKVPRRKSLGIIVDADADPAARWASLVERCSRAIGQRIDCTLDARSLGVVVEVGGQQKLGLWMMPNNTDAGMLETFMQELVGTQHNPLLQFARDCCGEIQRETSRFPRRFRSGHLDKAIIHTLLAWSDPPGRQLHQAIKESVLTGRESVLARNFADWFKKLTSKE